MENRLRGPAPRRRQRSAQDSGPKLQFVAWQSSPCLALLISAGLPNITACNFVGLSGAENHLIALGIRCRSSPKSRCLAAFLQCSMKDILTPCLGALLFGFGVHRRRSVLGYALV